MQVGLRGCSCRAQVLSYVVADTAARGDLIVRQLARAERVPRVFATAEGLDLARVADGLLAGAVLAPVAVPDAGSAAFEAYFAELVGHPPDDQALVVWRAIERAVGRVPDGPPAVQRVVVRGGRLEPFTP